ncbi:MAG: 50S ribosomal protein L22 [Acidobacteria bacterium]|nr:MAG: 50S ribosomal protein L22 [Acidobacteriota bacterium]
MVAKATLRYLKGSPQKVRLVVDQIRGRDVGDAMALLKHSRRRAARAVEKLLASAIANAQQREERLDVDKLYVSRAWVDPGPRERRGRPGPMGRFMPVLKRRSHVTLELDMRPAAQD